MPPTPSRRAVLGAGLGAAAAAAAVAINPGVARAAPRPSSPLRPEVHRREQRLLGRRPPARRHYDELGGFFDHVAPGIAPDAHPEQGLGLRGFRVPALVVSPRARRRHVAHGVYDHASVLKAVEWRWDLPPLTPRDAAAANIAEVLDFSRPVDLTAPRFPVPAFVGTPCPPNTPGLPRAGVDRRARSRPRQRMDPAVSLAPTGRTTTAAVVVALLVVLGTGLTPGPAATAAPETAAASARAPHVFVINLENKGFDETWGPSSPAPYLSRDLHSQGILLTQYYGTAHNSLPNYLAQISGQGPNPQTQGYCQLYSSFVGAGTAPPGQAVGQGCVYPAGVPTLPQQMSAAGLSWKGYMQDMGTPCRHPALNSPDSTQRARIGDQYAARHNPFVYFVGITSSPDCAHRDVDLHALPTDLAQVSTTPNLSYITPNLCDDDAPCVDGRPGGLASADAWLRTWAPKILNSPAFRQDGVLVTTFEESDGPQSDATACCGEGPSPNSPLPGITGLGGGRVGALVLTPSGPRNATVATPANHYSMLAALEDTFGLPRLGYATTATALSPLRRR